MAHVIQTRHIAAAIHTSADKDVRYFLNGVAVEGRVVVATDGHCASAYLGEECDEYLPPFIIPIDSAKLIAKVKASKVQASALPDGRIDVGGVVFTPVDGKYPDYRRVFTGEVDMTAPHNLQVMPELLMKFQKVAVALKAPLRAPYLYPTKGGIGFRVGIQGRESEFMGVLMPFSTKSPVLCGDWLK